MAISITNTTKYSVKICPLKFNPPSSGLCPVFPPYIFYNGESQIIRTAFHCNLIFNLQHIYSYRLLKLETVFTLEASPKCVTETLRVIRCIRCQMYVYKHFNAGSNLLSFLTLLISTSINMSFTIYFKSVFLTLTMCCFRSNSGNLNIWQA